MYIFLSCCIQGKRDELHTIILLFIVCKSTKINNSHSKTDILCDGKNISQIKI